MYNNLSNEITSTILEELIATYQDFHINFKYENLKEVSARWAFEHFRNQTADDLDLYCQKIRECFLQWRAENKKLPTPRDIRDIWMKKREFWRKREHDLIKVEDKSSENSDHALRIHLRAQERGGRVFSDVFRQESGLDKPPTDREKREFHRLCDFFAEKNKNNPVQFEKFKKWKEAPYPPQDYKYFH